MKEEAQKVIRAWDSLEGNKHHSVQETQNWIVNKLTPAIKQLRKKVPVDYNENCSRPDGCYSDVGRCLCNFGCDCSCHNEE